MRPEIVHDLIVDVGMSEGDDSDFYLRKGFNVIGIDADPIICGAVHRRFPEEVSARHLTILNRAASLRSGDMVEFFIDREAQGHSKVIDGQSAPERNGERIRVETIGWQEIVGIAGVPYYCKIDVEGAEVPFLESFRGLALPEFISVECHGFAPIETLYAIGYRRFRLLHQAAHNAFSAPDPPREGKRLYGYRFKHSSGYFGEELFHQVWANFRQVAGIFDALTRLRDHGALPHIWFDCHARFG